MVGRPNHATTREAFTPGLRYAGRVHAVRRRPIENRSPALALLRLEFEIFWIDDGQRRLHSLGKIACRDLVVTAGAADDDGVLSFAHAVPVARPENVDAWLALHDTRPWVTIEFGALDHEDDRNPFAKIFAFDPRGYTVREYDYRLDDDFVPLSASADALDTSVSTVRRRVDILEAQWGGDLVRRTGGGQRRVKLSLLKHVWDSK